MLILRRKIGERIIIDDRIEVIILRICGGKVRLGVAAPRSVRVLREEVFGIVAHRHISILTRFEPRYCVRASWTTA
jgi:carbon storage regulator